MANPIEIQQNTLLKLLVRRGSDSDRQGIYLDEGELGYTVDSKRLFVGDGPGGTQGGIVVGNKYLGSAPTIGELTGNAYEGDLASSGTTLYIRTNNAWNPVANFVESSGDIDIEVNAGEIATDAVGSSLEINNLGQIDLAPIISIDGITIRTPSSYLSLPNEVRIGSINYDFPTGGGSNGHVLTTDGAGGLSWKRSEASQEFLFNTENGPLPVGAVVPFAISTNLPTGWVLCDGSAVSRTDPDYSELFDVIGTSYGIGDGSTTFNVPNYLNKTLYGVTNNPQSSTIYGIGSGAELSSQDSIPIARARFSGSVSGLSQEGFSSVVRNSAGVYTLTFATPRASNSYSVIATREAGNPLEGDVVVRNRTTTSFVLHSSNDNSSPGDPDGIHVVVFEKASNSGGGSVSTVLPLSATGAVYIIKAKGDSVLEPSLTIQAPLTATLNGSQVSTDFNHLSGDLAIGLDYDIVTSLTPADDSSLPTSLAVKDYVDTSASQTQALINAPEYSGTTGTIPSLVRDNWTTVDLSSIVGSNRAIVYLQIVSVQQDNLFFRTAGSSIAGRFSIDSRAGWGVSSVAVREDATDGPVGGMVIVITNTSGEVEVYADDANHSNVPYEVVAFQVLS